MVKSLPAPSEPRAFPFVLKGTHVNLRLGVRHWEHVSPIAMGDVRADIEVGLTRLDSTPDLWDTDDLDGGETSLSRYVRARAAGDDRVVGLPVFLMTAFRHRCIIVRADSPAEQPADLRGARIGLTGWPDSGNTWTRAIFSEAGVGVADAHWRVGRLTSAHPAFDRIGGVSVPDNVEQIEDADTLVGLLAAGSLDAVLTPFMPPGFHDGSAGLRPLYRDTRAAEIEYYERHRFVPGIHLLAVRRDVFDQGPEVPQGLLDLFEQSKRVSRARRDKLTDVSPWHNEEVAATAQVFDGDWMPYGYSANQRMVSEFQDALVAQGRLDEPVPAGDLFPLALEPGQETIERAFA
jgi:4,5-dihydroxyphthalate decarboxylase